MRMIGGMGGVGRRGDCVRRWRLVWLVAVVWIFVSFERGEGEEGKEEEGW